MSVFTRLEDLVGHTVKHATYDEVCRCLHFCLGSSGVVCLSVESAEEDWHSINEVHVIGIADFIGHEIASIHRDFWEGLPRVGGGSDEIVVISIRTVVGSELKIEIRRNAHYVMEEDIRMYEVKSPEYIDKIKNEHVVKDF